MIRDRFAYHAPGDAEEAVALLADAGEEAAIVGGGTWVVWEMHRAMRRPRVVVDLRRAALAGVRTQDGEVHVGAMTPYSDLLASDDVPPLLRTMAAGITGGAQIRNQGTLGGSACYANPGSDAPSALAALGATMRITGPGGTRDVPAAEFVRAPFRSAVDPGEVLTAIVVPRPVAGERQGYVKFKVAESSWPILTAGCVLGPDGELRRLALGGGEGRPLVLEGGAPDEVAARVTHAIREPWSDVLADGAYRRRIAGVVARRAVEAARGDEGGLG